MGGGVRGHPFGRRGARRGARARRRRRTRASRSTWGPPRRPSRGPPRGAPPPTCAKLWGLGGSAPGAGDSPAPLLLAPCPAPLPPPAVSPGPAVVPAGRAVVPASRVLVRRVCRCVARASGVSLPWPPPPPPFPLCAAVLSVGGGPGRPLKWGGLSPGAVTAAGRLASETFWRPTVLVPTFVWVADPDPRKPCRVPRPLGPRSGPCVCECVCV